MDHGHADRPTSGASAADLVAQLRETRLRTRRLTEDLSWAELMGPYLGIVNPVLWEIGHVAWFHEYWTLRHAARPRAADRALRPVVGFERGARTPRAGISTFPTAPAPWATWPTCWRARKTCSAAAIDDQARYFYDLAIRHEDMHVEALTYIAPDPGLCAAARASVRPGVRVPGRCPAMSPCRAAAGGSARPRKTASSSTTRSGRTMPRWRRSDRPRAGDQCRVRRFRRGRRLPRREFWSDAGWAWRATARGRAARLLARQARRRVDGAPLSRGSRNWRRTRPSCS